MLVWIAFAACTAVIFVAGTQVSKYGDVIAEKTGLGRTWIGFVLLAAITSLPELVTGVSAAALARAPDLAVGGVLGSCAFNILILAMLDALYPQPIYGIARHGHIISAGFGIMLLSFVCAALFLGGMLPPVLWIGFYSVIFLLVYGVAMRLTYRYEKREMAEFVTELAEELKYRTISSARAYVLFIANSGLIVAAALFLPVLAESIAESTGLGQTFVGTLFLAVATSLPEIVISVAAVRLGATDMAVANIFGSNMFNIAILAVDDLAYTAGPILSAADPNNLIPAIGAIAMSSVAVIGLAYRPGKKKLLLGWSSRGIIALYVLTMTALFLLRV